jgi:hypothetical protein
MAYRCQKCDSPILVLRLGVCANCREPIPSEILPEAKKQALDREEREYEESREQAIKAKGIKREGIDVDIDRLLSDDR